MFLGRKAYKDCIGIKFAFTLAEVLIVLGIIGVVAELTIPTLVQNTQAQVIKVNAKKQISVLNQVLTMINTDNGSLQGQCADSAHACLRNLFLPYLKYIKTCDPPNNSGCISSNVLNSGWESGSSVVLNDGTSVLFYAYNSACTGNQGDLGMQACGEALVDLNGSNKKPNGWISVKADGTYGAGDLLWIEISPNLVHYGYKNLITALD